MTSRKQAITCIKIGKKYDKVRGRATYHLDAFNMETMGQILETEPGEIPFSEDLLC